MGARSDQDVAFALADWQEIFLDHLAHSSNVAASARKAGVNPSLAYAARRRDGEFNRRWQIALAEGYDLLEIEVLRRLREGELKAPPAKAGEKARAVRVFDNGLAVRLLIVHKEAVARARAQRDEGDPEMVRAGLEAKLDAMRDALENGLAGSADGA